MLPTRARINLPAIVAVHSWTPFLKARHFHWSQQRLAFVKTLIYTFDFTPAGEIATTRSAPPCCFEE
jgi:hypothetical protein